MVNGSLQRPPHGGRLGLWSNVARSSSR